MIGIVGLGFVGLTTALGFCERTDYNVYAVEKDVDRFNMINSGKVPFYEPGLSEALENYLDKRLHLVSGAKQLIEKFSVIYYCVGTPAGDDGNADLSILESAIKETFAEYKSSGDYKVIVIKSTVPPGTTSKKVTEIVKELGLTEVGIANNPEFLREGYSWDDFINPDRIVIGQSDDRAGDLVAKLYDGFNAPVFKVSLNTGEYIKYLSNTLLATLISYSNEMSMVADCIGEIDVKTAFDILHMDKRWSGSPAKMSTYVLPGCGYGGYCLPKDTEAMYAKAKSSGANPQLLGAVIKTNNDIKPHILEKIMNIASKKQKIGVLGLSFKPESDDIRDTPARYFIEGLLKAGYENITAHDPIAVEGFKKTYNFPIYYENNLDSLIRESDALVIVTAWDVYKDKTEFIKSKPFVDARYCL